MTSAEKRPMEEVFMSEEELAEFGGSIVMEPFDPSPVKNKIL